MTVELAAVKRGDMSEQITVVGNLIGAATVEAVPKVSGRLEDGHGPARRSRDARASGSPRSRTARFCEQVKQAQASFDVAAATIRQREADLKLAQTNLDRSRNLFERQLIPRQTFDDTDARYQAAAGPARPRTGAVFAGTGPARRAARSTLRTRSSLRRSTGSSASGSLDPGAWVTPNAPFISVVDISVVRLVANVVEKDLRRVTQGMQADVVVDAFPGEKFDGRVAHVAPVLDPATRTAQIEIEIQNSQFRLKPGHVREGRLHRRRKDNTLVVPANAIVDLNGKKGVFLPRRRRRGEVQAGHRRHVSTRHRRSGRGLPEGTRVVTTGAAALREGDRIVLLGQGGGGRGARRRGWRDAAGSGSPQVRRRAASCRGKVRRRVVRARRPSSGGRLRTTARRGCRRGRQRSGTPGGAATAPGAAGAAAAAAVLDGSVAESQHIASGAGMSIPRFAIQRPVMMAMISSIVILIGGISLTRLPVDLLPDISQPTVNVRVNYTGVGPLEMEDLIVTAARAAAQRRVGTRHDVLQRQRGQCQHPDELHLGHGPQRSDERHPHAHRSRPRPPARRRRPAGRAEVRLERCSRSWASALESTDGTLDRVQLRELAENILSPRLERVSGVAAVTVDGGLRRQIHVDLSREKITALDLSVDRVVNVLKNENQNIPIGEVYQGDRSLLLRSQGQFQNLEQIRNLVVLTKNGVPVYLKDIADVTDSTEDVRSVLRINGRPGVRMQVTKQSGTNTVQIAEGVRAEIERINREVPGVKISLLDDSAKFIERSISAVQEHVMLGSVLVILIIFLFLRNFRSTLIVCTSIPISVIGTFALLYFGGLTLNTMTFGGLALGVGMIVDAAIVVLENSFRHMEHHGKDRMTASIDGSEEVWSAILASILTHIAVFVPLLFLDGRVEHHVPAAVGRRRLLAADVAVRGGHAGAGAVLAAARAAAAADQRKGIGGKLYTLSERFLDGMDEGYRRLLHSALAHRPIVVGAGRRVGGRRGRSICRTLPTEFATQTDEGQVQVSVELAQGTRIEVTDAGAAAARGDDQPEPCRKLPT